MSRSKNLPSTPTTLGRPPPVAVTITGIQGNVAAFASPGPAHDVWRRQLKTALGTDSDAFVDMALHHLERAARMPGAGPSDLAISGALAVIAAFAPKNEVEAALAVQAAGIHMVSMVMMARIGGGHSVERRLPPLAATAAKLVRAFCTAVETHRRLRVGGEQKITVQHVTVNEGGQAIVGSVNPQAGQIER